MKDIKDMNLEEVRQKIYEHALAINNDELYSLLDRLDELTRWIPVSERMPDGDYFVLVTVEGDGWPMVAFYDGKWYPSDIWDEIDTSRIVSWQRITPPEDK
jgi:hypothetical protein